MSRPRHRRASRRAMMAAVTIVCAIASCAPVDEPPPDDGPPPPDRFTTEECDTSTTNPAAEIDVGVGFGAFETAEENGDPIPILAIDGVSYAYFSIQVRHTALENVCVQYRLDVAEPDEPNEALAFDRYLLDLEPTPPRGGIVRGIAAKIETPEAVSGKRAFFVVDASDGLVSGHLERFATFE